MPLECFLLNITLRDLPRKCKKKQKMRENVDRIPPPLWGLGGGRLLGGGGCGGSATVGGGS